MQINEVANTLQISKRTIRYYEQRGLLSVKVNELNGYRQYSEEQLELLREIIYFRSLQITIKDIEKLINASQFELRQFLINHLHVLRSQRDKLNDVITQVEQIVQFTKGDAKMTINEFKLQKQKWIRENEERFGNEIREIHGEDSVMASYGKVKDMSEEQFKAATQLEDKLFERIQESMDNDTTELYMEIAELHKRWLSFYWPKYTKQAHAGLAMIYIADERFIEYYDAKLGDGATQLLHDAIIEYSKK